VGHAWTQIFDQFRRIYDLAIYRRNRNENFILAVLAWYCHGGRLAYGGVTTDFNLHFEGGNILTTPTNGILETIDEEITSIPLAKGVAGMEPAISPGSCCALRVQIVAVVDDPWLRRPQNQFADFAVRKLAIVSVHNPDLDALASTAARGTASSGTCAGSSTC